MAHVVIGKPVPTFPGHGLMESIYASETPLQVLFVTGLIGGAAAWLAGRAIAHTWRPWWHLIPYMLILGIAVRFFHVTLFNGTALSPHYYAVDTAVALLLGRPGFPVTPQAQMRR